MKISRLFLLLSLVLLMSVLGCTPAAKPTPVLSITSTQSSFVNKTAYVNLSLSSPSETDVVISLKASGDIDTQYLSFENPVTIPAGSTSAGVIVVLDDSKLEPGEYNVTLSVSGAAGAKLEGNTSVSLRYARRKAIAEITLTGPDRFSEDGKATLTLTPDVPPVKSVTVMLEVRKAGASEGKQLIPPRAITCPETVILPADQASPTTFTVTLDLTQLSPIESEAIIAIEAVSEGGSIVEPGLVRIGAKGTLTPKQKQGWNISYTGDEAIPAYGGMVLSRISAQAPQTDGNYYVFVYEKEEWKSQVSSIEEYLLWEEDYINYWIQQGDPEKSYSGAVTILFDRFIVGDYVGFMLGCDESGHLTGEYAECNFSREPTPYMQQQYSRWLGEWEVNGTVWTISADKENTSYKITNFLGYGATTFPAYLGWEGELELHGMSVDSNSQYEFFGGYYYDKDGDGQQEYYLDYYESTVVASAVMDGSSAQWSGAPCYRGVPFINVHVFELASGESTHNTLELPEYMCRAHAGSLPEDAPVYSRFAPYEAFLGEWDYMGMPLVIKQKEAGVSYWAIQTEDPDLSFQVEITYKDGSLHMAEQIVGYDEYEPGVEAQYWISGVYKEGTQREGKPHFLYGDGNAEICPLYMQKDGGVLWYDSYLSDCDKIGAFIYVPSYHGYAMLGDDYIPIGKTMYRPAKKGATAAHTRDVARVRRHRL